MQFLPAIDLWNAGNHRALLNGQLKLQMGQLVYCGRTDHPSRFVGVTPAGSIWAAHWQGSEKATRERFKTLCESFKAMTARA